MTAPITDPPTTTGSTHNVRTTVTETAGTEYVILEASAADKSWKERGQVTAPSADAAIRKHIGTPSQQTAATFIAIPARSWKPVKVTPQTVTTLKLEEAK